MYLALGIVFLLAIALGGVGITVTLVRASKDGAVLLSKKNLFYLAPVFLVLYFLHLTAALYNGEEIDFFYCFSLVNSTLDVFAFKSQRALVLPLCTAQPIFYADFILAYLIGIIAAILSVASFFNQRIRNFIAVRRLLRKSCDIVLGTSPDAIRYVKNNKNSLVLGAGVSRKAYAELLKDGTPVLRLAFEAKPLLRKLKRREHNLIAFRDSRFSYTKIIDVITAITDGGGRASVHLEANQDEMKILKEKFISSASSGAAHIYGFSKYELMARRFVVDHPITKYIPRDFYNENLTLKKDKEIRVVFVGFGKVNYQLFRMCAMQFQFAKEKGKGLVAAPVQYYVFDHSDTALHNEFFSRILFEADEEFRDCDFPEPEEICKIKTQHVDINSIEVKKQFKSLVGKDAYTYFIVSLESDLEDASYAQTIRRLLPENGNYKIFVRAKNASKERLNGEDDELIYFGEERALYTHENIVNNDLAELAKRINLMYNGIKDKPKWLTDLRGDSALTPKEREAALRAHMADPKKRAYMDGLWNNLIYIKQASNLYHALNLPFKLNMLGFDMVKNVTAADKLVSEADFNKVYRNSGRGSGYNNYSFYFGLESSNVLAFIEHLRWNALYILCDYRQMKKADMTEVEELGEGIRNLNHQNNDKKQHACITTYSGLDELVRFKYSYLCSGKKFDASRFGSDKQMQELAKIYTYDYMDLDRLYSEVITMGYEIIELKN
ncbi:MAG: hypothetical protein K2L87_07115 [Clostridiales bacterium]|nr:hypothetical protein [Clostridiales bacterium]